MNENLGSPLDGNAASGELRELFALDISAALGECGGCGTTKRLADDYFYDNAPGMVLRCAHCQSALLRVVKSPTSTWLDMRGLSYVQIANPPVA